MRASIFCWQELDLAEGTQPLQAYAIANLGGIRAIIVSATVCSAAAGLSLHGCRPRAGLALLTQLLRLSSWCRGACFEQRLLAWRARSSEA